MLRRPTSAVVVLALSLPLLAQDDVRSLLRPITGNVHERTMRLDVSTGRARRVPPGLAATALETVFDNTCEAAYFLGLRTQTQSGGTGPMAAGDWGALPDTSFGGRSTCTPGCADSYEIRQFTIAYCTEDDVPIDMVLHFWDRTATGGSGLNACSGVELIGGSVPPVYPRAPYPASPTGMADFTVTGLPRNSTTGTHFSACYAIDLMIDTPGFVLNGGSSGLVNFSTMGDRFSWSMQVLTGTGNTGPIFAGNSSFGTSCRFCTGTVWERGGQSTDGGIGLGETVVFWLDNYNGSSGAPTHDCYFFDSSPYGSFELVLDAHRPCGGEPGSFCDGSDASLAACPCGNAGLGGTGCDNAQGTGGVGLSVVAQTTGPNGSTLRGTGFPAMSSPTVIALRSSVLLTTPLAFGDGVLCLGASPLVRLAATTASGGTSTHSFGHGAQAGPGDFFYQLWYRNTPSTFCDPAAAFNLSSGVELVW